MSQVEVDKIIPQSGTTLTIGDSGDTITIPSGVTLSNSGIITNFESTGIDDNATSTAITIDSSQNVDVNGTVTADGLTVDGGGEIATFGNTTGNNSITVNRTVTGPSSASLGAYTSTGVILYSGSAGFKFTNTLLNQDSLRIANNGDILFYEDTGTTAKFFWDASAERLGIGTASPTQALDVNGLAYPLVINSTNGNLYKIQFKDNGVNRGYIGCGSTAVFSFADASASEFMRIDNLGNLLVGTTSITAGVTSSSGKGIALRSEGYILASIPNDSPLVINRQTSDGNIAQFRKDGITVGTIFSRSGVVSGIILDPRAGGNGLLGQTGAIIPVDESQTREDNATDLGNSTYRYKDLYLGGGLYVGGTGTANKLDDYEEGLHEATLTTSVSGSVALGGTENTLSYVKIGNLVNVQGALGVNVPSSPVGYIKISMPFTAASLLENADNSACSLFINNVNSATVGDFIGYVLNGTSELRIFLGDTTYAEADSAQQLRSGTSITLNVSYRTT
jgi:hypothetical protein